MPYAHNCASCNPLACRLPWDPVYLVESLSDSTIYMAYYAGGCWWGGARVCVVVVVWECVWVTVHVRVCVCVCGGVCVWW